MANFEVKMKNCLYGMLLLTMPVFADDCSDALNEAKRKYNAGNYSTAKELFEYVQEECGKTYGSADTWIQKCNQALNPSQKQQTLVTPSVTLVASQTQVNASSEGTTLAVSISSNRDWYIANVPANWCKVTKSGTGITLKIFSNSTTDARRTSVQIKTADGQKSLTLYVSQAAKTPTSNAIPSPATTNNSSAKASSSSSYSGETTLSVSKSYIYATASGVTEYITVTSNRSWEIQYPSGGMYSAWRDGNKVIVNISANTTNGSREDFFNIRTTDGSKVQKISLSQTGRSSGSSKSSSSTNSSGNTTTNTTTLSVSKTSISASSYGTTEYITVTSNKPWEVQYPSGPIYSVTRSGNTLTVKIKENISEESHVDFFYVKTTDGSKVQKISLSQTGSTSSSSSSSNKNRSYRHSSYSKPLSKFNSSNGDFEMFWWGISTGLGTAYSFESSAFAMRWSWFGFDPIIGGVKYSFLSDDFVGYYQPDFKFYIPWNSECAVTLAVGPSIEFGGYYGADFWFKTELGIHWHYGYATSSNFFLRYDGDFTAGVSIQFSSGW